MDTTTRPDSASRKARTYMAPDSAKTEIIDFAQFMRDLEAYSSQNSSRAALVDPNGNPRPIPEEIFQALEQVANALAAGHGVTVAPYGALLTTQQAADFLGVSRPTLVKLLEGGEIEFEKRNRHRRVKLRALLAYQERSRQERRAGLEDLARSNAHAKILIGDPSSIERGE